MRLDCENYTDLIAQLFVRHSVVTKPNNPDHFLFTSRSTSVVSTK